eukprot:6088630-Amphidinium_carterae.1
MTTWPENDLPIESVCKRRVNSTKENLYVKLPPWREPTMDCQASKGKLPLFGLSARLIPPAQQLS